MKEKNKSLTVIVYLCIFYSLWAVNEFILKDALNETIENQVLCQLVKTALIKNLVWSLPAVLLIRHFKDSVSIPLREMFTSKVQWSRYLPVFGIFTGYIIGGFIISKAPLNISETFSAEEFIVFLFVGATEELVFRGWLLNIMYHEDKKYQCIFVNSLMFLAIHFPKWIHDGIFITSFTGFGFVGIIILSFIFSLAFIKSRNIFVPIALHMYWDLLLFLIY